MTKFEAIALFNAIRKIAARFNGNTEQIASFIANIYNVKAERGLFVKENFHVYLDIYTVIRLKTSKETGLIQSWSISSCWPENFTIY